MWFSKKPPGFISRKKQLMQKNIKKYTFKKSTTTEILVVDKFKDSKEKISGFIKKADKICLITDSFCHLKFKTKINELKKENNDYNWLRVKLDVRDYK